MKHKNVKSRELTHEVLRVTNITFLQTIPLHGQEERLSPKEKYFDLQVILVRTSVWRISMWILGFKRITANNAKRPIKCNYIVNCRHDDIRHDTRFLSTSSIWAWIGVNIFPC